MALAEIPPPSARPRRAEGRVPPNNLEAEESLLGAMLLSREAIAATSDVHLSAADFYRPAHGHIFDAILSLYSAGEPVDPVTVADELRRADLLDAIGGTAVLVGIQARTPATSSAPHYARIVGEHALLRRLIGVAGEIAEIGYSLPDDVIAAVDRAESMVFDVAQHRETDTTRQIKDLLDLSLNRLEELYARGEAITGLPTGYNGLDEMLSGLQPSTLNIVGARPAIGKCVAADTLLVDPATGARVTLAELVEHDDIEVVTLDDDHRLTVRRPSAVVDDGVKPVFRVRLRTGREVRTTASHPFLTANGWRPLADLAVGTRVAVPRELPIFGDEPMAEERLVDLARRVGVGRVDRGVPAAVFRLPADQLATFLAHVLATSELDAGAIPEISYRTPCGAVARDVQHLLLRFGVNARIRRRVVGSGADRRPGWQLTISHPDEIRAFERRIGIAGREAELHHVARRACAVHRQHVRDTEAVESWDEVRAARRRVATTTARLARSGRLTAVYDDQRLAIGSPSAIWWDEIVAIEADGMTQVYDLTVPGEHNFVAADVFVHNTAFALGMASHAALEVGRPVLFFSLEMGHLELTQRLLAAEARVDGAKLRTGQLNDAEWNKISHAIGRLAEAPLFIDDNPHATVMEIRAKSRRLRSKLGDLGLVVIDYLQLMTGRMSAENRQVEVSEISRGLKILARELETPVVALSQLSRQLELRADKRPMLADLRESGCLTADSTVLRADTGAEVTMGELLASGERDVPVWSLDEHLKMVPATMTHVFPSGVKETFELRLASGRSITASGNHPFLGFSGWTRLDELAVGSRIAVPRTVPEPLKAEPWHPAEIVMLAHLIGDGCVASRQPIHYTSGDLTNVETVEEAAEHFGITPRRVQQQSWWHVYLPAPHKLTHGKRNPIAEWLGRFDLYGLRSWEKFVPAELFSVPDDQIASFLHHLWATDGSVRWDGKQARIYYATTSRRLADDVQHLLLRLGIHSRVREVAKSGYRPSFHVLVTGLENVTRFVEGVGVHGARGERVAEVRAAIDRLRANTNVDTILEDERLHDLATSDVFWDTVVAIEPRGPQAVYDATVLGTHNFVSNGIVLHNSLEQDADVVMFLYRDEVYHADSADRGTAEVIVSKHRSGPTGVDRLTFINNYTRFANMAKGM